MTRTTPLLDPADPRLEPFRDVRDRDLAGRHGAFMLEGRVVLEAALTHRPELLRALLLSERAARGLADLLPRLPLHVPVYTLPDPALEAVVGFDLHRGILALAARPALPSLPSLLATLPPDARVLVLEDLTNHDNVGACFRNAAALHAHAVLLTAATCDPLYRKSVRVAAGHVLTLPWTTAPSIADLLHGLLVAGFATCALTCDPQAPPLPRAWPHPGPLAILLGSEGPGLTPQALRLASHRFTLPMRPGVDSLNVATAGAVALWSVTPPGP